MPGLNEINKELKRLLKSTTFETTKTVASYEQEIIAIYKASLVKIRNEVAALLSKYNDPTLISIRALNDTANSIEKILTGASKETVPMIKNSIIDTYSYNYGAVGTSLQTSLGTTTSFGVINTNAVNAAVINPYTKISWPTILARDTVKANSVVRNAVTKGIITGEPFATTSRIITNELNITTGKAMNIIRTETHRAVSEARILALEDARGAAERLGFKLYKIWQSAFVPATRVSHGNLDGSVADENGMWYFDDGVATEAPGASGDPAHDVNCLCQIISELGDTNAI